VAYSSTNEGEYAGVTGYGGNINVPKDIKWSEFNWKDPNTGSDYTTATWSYQVELVVKGIERYNATIKIRGKETGSTTWAEFDSKNWTNQTITNPDQEQTLTFSDTGSEAIDTHMNRFISNPQSGTTYTLQYQIYFEFHGLGVKSGQILNVTLSWTDLSTQPSAQAQFGPAWGADYYDSSTGQYETALIDGSDSTYKYVTGRTYTSTYTYLSATLDIAVTGGPWTAVKFAVRGKYAKDYTSNSLYLWIRLEARKFDGSATALIIDSWYFQAGTTKKNQNQWYEPTGPASSTFNAENYIQNGRLRLYLTVRGYDLFGGSSKHIEVWISEIKVIDYSSSWIPVGFPAILIILVFIVVAMYVYLRRVKN
jgi:hypothetical protein